MAIANMVRSWIEIENTKREWRGIPRLSPHKLAEVIAAKRASAKTISANHDEQEPLELDAATAPSTEPSKESLN